MRENDGNPLFFTARWSAALEGARPRRHSNPYAAKNDSSEKNGPSGPKPKEPSGHNAGCRGSNRRGIGGNGPINREPLGAKSRHHRVPLKSGIQRIQR